jgi:hypothetical protein
LVFSDLGRISPRRKDPKKAVQHAAQKTFLLAGWGEGGFQLLIAISWPINLSKRKDMSNFVGLQNSEYYAIFLAPFSIELRKKSFSNSIFFYP